MKIKDDLLFMIMLCYLGNNFKGTIIKHKISIPIAVFSVISVTIGAGMVSVPKSAYNSGIPFAIGYHLFNLISWIYSIHLLIRWGEATGLTSMAQLGYECFGYYSLYIVNFAQFIAFGLLPIAYFIIFSDLLSSFLQEINWVNDHSQNFIGSRWFSVLILAVLVFPLVIKKRITELKVAGVLLFTGVSLFIILMFVMRIFSSSALDIDNKNFDGLYRLIVDKQFLSSLSNAFVAYGFQSAFYPIYNSLENRTYKNGMKFTIFGMVFWFIISKVIILTIQITVHRILSALFSFTIKGCASSIII